jgi:hypothetical protein
MAIPILARRFLLAMLDRRGGMKSWRLLSRNDQPLLPQPLLSLLDRYPSTHPAWGLHRLRAAHAGACIRVRRVSDNVEADIGFATDGSLDVAALASHCGASDGRVTVAYDQNTTAGNFVQTSAELQPRVFIGGAGVVENEHGQPAMESTEAGMHRLQATTTLYIPPDPISFALVVTKTISDAQGALLSNGSSTGNIWNRWAGAYESGAGTAPSNQAGSVVHYVDGVVLSPTTRAALHDALQPGGERTTVALQFRTLGLPNWNFFVVMGYGGGAGFATDALFSAGVMWRDTDLTLADFHDASAELRELFGA